MNGVEAPIILIMNRQQPHQCVVCRGQAQSAGGGRKHPAYIRAAGFDCSVPAVGGFACRAPGEPSHTQHRLSKLVAPMFA